MKTLSILPLIIMLTALTGCVDRQSADKRLIKACQAGIEAFLPEDYRIDAITSQNIGDSATLGHGYREVVLNLEVSDGYHVNDEKHSCIFFEEFAFARLSHRVSIYQLNSGDQIIGQENYQIKGSIADMQKLTGAIDKALQK